jgi:hypothetical protein
MPDASTINLMNGFTDVIIFSLGVLSIYGLTKDARKDAGDSISRKSAELSIALWSVAIAIPFVALAYVGWAIERGFVAFNEGEIATTIITMALLGTASFYLSRGRTFTDLLRNRREWR